MGVGLEIGVLTQTMEGLIMETESEKDLEATISTFKTLEKVGEALHILTDEHQRIRLAVQEKLGIGVVEFDRRYRRAKDEGRF